MHQWHESASAERKEEEGTRIFLSRVRAKARKLIFCVTGLAGDRKEIEPSKSIASDSKCATALPPLYILFHFPLFHFVLSIASEITRERDLAQIYDGVLHGAAVVHDDDDDDDDEEDDEDDGDESDHREASYTYWMIIILMNTRHDSTSQSAESPTRRSFEWTRELENPIILPILRVRFFF